MGWLNRENEGEHGRTAEIHRGRASGDLPVGLRLSTFSPRAVEWLA